MTHFIVLTIGLLSGYLLGFAGVRYQRTDDIQAEYQAHECGAGRPREVSR
jgi:hypothetical protein